MQIEKISIKGVTTIGSKKKNANVMVSDLGRQTEQEVGSEHMHGDESYGLLSPDHAVGHHTKDKV